MSYKRSYNNRVRAPEPTTFSRFAASDADTLIGGRFGAVDQNKVIVGSTARPDYPPAAPHQTDPTGIEPPISFQDTVEPTGTHQEIAASLGDVCSDAPSAPEHTSGDVEAPPGFAPSSASEITSPPLKRKRKKA